MLPTGRADSASVFARFSAMARENHASQLTDFLPFERELRPIDLAGRRYAPQVRQEQQGSNH